VPSSNSNTRAWGGGKTTTRSHQKTEGNPWSSGQKHPGRPNSKSNSIGMDTMHKNTNGATKRIGPSGAGEGRGLRRNGEREMCKWYSVQLPKAKAEALFSTTLRSESGLPRTRRRN